MHFSTVLGLFPKQRLRGGVLTFDVHKWAGTPGFLVAGLAVAGGFGGRWPWLWLGASGAGGRGCGCGWSALVQMRCVWLGLELCVSSLGSCRVCFHNASCDCLHVFLFMLTWLLACIAAWLPTDDAR